MIYLRHHQIMALVNADWRSPGPVRLNASLTLDDLSGSLALNHARLVMERLEAEGGVKVTTTGNFNRSFVALMVDAFDWPGYGPEVVKGFRKALNEPDFPPLNFLHAILALSGLGRKHKGRFRLTRRGGSLLRPEAAGELNVVLFEATFQRYNLAYLDFSPIKDHFQLQISLTLYLLSKVADEPKPPAQLVKLTIDPIEQPDTPYPWHPEAVFRWRVLKYLEWFGLMDEVPAAADDDRRNAVRYRKTPLYDRFLAFDIEAMSP